MSRTALITVLSTLLLFSVQAPAATANETVAFRSGGSSSEDFAKLDRLDDSYSLKLVLAAKGSGAYLADVDIEVRALPSRNLVLTTRTEGPLLLASLAPGRYEVTGSVAGRSGATSTVKQTVLIPASGMHKMVMYFETGDNVSPESGAEYRTH
jgi:hypothetical protein